MESKKYPELYLSSGLEKIVSAFPPIKCGTAPQKPKQPQCPKEPSNDPGCVSFGIASGVLALFAYCLGAQKNVDIIIVCTIAAFVFIFLHFSFSSQHEKDLKEFNLKKIEYEREHHEYLLKLAEYEEKKIKFDEAKQFALEESQKQCNFVPFRQEQLRKYIKGHKPLYSSSNKEILEGPIEEKFFNLCLQYGLRVTRNKVANVSGYNYYPDIVWDSDGMLFDIEIDEPYTIADGSPIHYLDNYGKSIDADRNKRFIQSNWNVIRFSEEQICKYPIACVCFLLAVANSIRRGVFDVDRLFLEYSLLRTDKWDKEQSHKWAYFHYRETYLHLIDNLPSIKYNIINTDHTSYIPMFEDSESEEYIRWYEDDQLETTLTVFPSTRENGQLDLSKDNWGIRYLKKEKALIPIYDSLLNINLLELLPNTIHVEDRVIEISQEDFGDSGCYAPCHILELESNYTITEIILNIGIKSLGFASFACLKKLKTINLPIGLLEIKAFAFYGCEELSKIDIPGSVNNIPRLAFGNCYSLEKINLQEGIVAINEYAFDCCVSLKNLVLPKSLTFFNMDSIQGCEHLETVTINNPYMCIIVDQTIDQYSYPSNLKKIYVPNGSLDYYSIYFPIELLDDNLII